METGASSACFYPLETEKSFLNIAELGFKCAEIFFNAHSELSPRYLNELKAIKDAYGIEVVSLHPYGSFGEGYDFFSAYKRRFYDGIEQYKRYYNAAAVLGAEYIVMHGASKLSDIGMEEYAERYAGLNEAAKPFGCSVAHENVVHFVSAAPDFHKYMKSQLGDSYKAVLDIKQARRAGYEPKEFIDTLGKNIVHVHLSDYSEAADCIAPAKEGLFDFEKLFSDLDKIGYSGKYIVELYSDGYKEKSEIINSGKYLDALLKKMRQEQL